MVRLNLAKQKQALDGLEFRLIDYLPAWTLVLINPSKDNRASGGIVYVELATYRPQHGNRPTFTVEYNLEPELFERFCDEFEQMWEIAQKPEG